MPPLSQPRTQEHLNPFIQSELQLIGVSPHCQSRNVSGEVVSKVVQGADSSILEARERSTVSLPAQAFLTCGPWNPASLRDKRIGAWQGGREEFGPGANGPPASYGDSNRRCEVLREGQL